MLHGYVHSSKKVVDGAVKYSIKVVEDDYKVKRKDTNEFKELNVLQVSNKGLLKGRGYWMKGLFIWVI